MFNNSGTEAKYNITLDLDGTTGIKGEPEGLQCYAETQLRVEINNVGPTNVTYIQARIRNSSNWYEIDTVIGTCNNKYDISTYDYIRYVILVADGFGEIIGSGFFFKYNSGVGPVPTPSLTRQQVISSILLDSDQTLAFPVSSILFDDVSILYNDDGVAV